MVSTYIFLFLFLLLLHPFHHFNIDSLEFKALTLLQKRSSIFSHRTFGFWNVYIMRLCTLARSIKMILFLSFSARSLSFHQSTIHFSTISFYTWHSLHTLIYLFIQFFFFSVLQKCFLSSFQFGFCRGIRNSDFSFKHLIGLSTILQTFHI